MNSQPRSATTNPAIRWMTIIALIAFYPLVVLLGALEDRRRQRQLSLQLAHIDARTLRDAGISEASRFLGVHRPFD